MTNTEPDRQRSYDDFTYVPNLVFKSMGYDFLATPKPKWQAVGLRVYWNLCWLSHWYLVYYLILRTIEWDSLAGNPTAIMQFASVYFFVFNSDVKCLIFMFNRRRLRELVDKLRTLYPSGDNERREYRVNEFYWPRIARYGFLYYYFVELVVIVGPIIQSACMYLYQRLTSAGEITFPYLSTFPMERIKLMTPMSYAFSQLVDCTFSHFIVNVNLGTDIWMMCLSGQLCMQFAHLARKLETYSPSRQSQSKDCQFLVSLIQKHQLLLSLHKELNDIFSMLLAYNLFSTATILCCVAVYSILQGLNREGFGFLMFFISYSAQFYMVSYYGQLLIDFSESIALAAYTHSWYNGSPAYRKYLILIMQRAQKPAHLSAKGVIIISVVSFTNMINITYRFLAVIRRLLGK